LPNLESPKTKNGQILDNKNGKNRVSSGAVGT